MGSPTILTGSILVCVLVGVAALAWFVIDSGRVVVPGWFHPNDVTVFAMADDPVSWDGFVTADAVNLREGASLDAQVLASISSNERVLVTGGMVAGFLPVEAAGRSGWMSADFVSRNPSSGGTEAIVDSAPESVQDAPEPQQAVVVPTLMPTARLSVVPTRVPPPQDLSPEVDASAAEGERWIDVDRGTAKITLYIGTEPQRVFQGKIGRDPAVDGFYSTAVGTFHVYSMEAGLASTPFVEDVYMSDWVGFDPVRKNGFHSPVRNADGSVRESQNATTMGCVRLEAEAAVQLYSFAYVGMRVEIHD